MAAWHEPSSPRVPPRFLVGFAVALYFTSMLALVGWILYRLLVPLPHLIP